MRVRCVGALLGIVACGTPRPPDVPVAPVPEAVDLTAPDAPIVLRESVVADEWFWLRAKVLDGNAPEAFREAVVAMRDLKEELGADASAWEDLELPLGSCSSARELVGRFSTIPEKLEVDGRTVALRAGALRVAAALVATEQAYLRGPFEAHDVQIRAAAHELGPKLVAAEKPLLEALKRDMQLPVLPESISVTLVVDAPYPTAFAADARGHHFASFVRVGALDAGDLTETILAESLHACDEITVKVPTAMNALRSALVNAGLDESDSNIEMVVNTVTFAEAASLVRRFVDPKHESMAKGGFFAIYPPAESISKAWGRYVDGESLDVTTAAIVAAVVSRP